jgi:hypothetical protein
METAPRLTEDTTDSYGDSYQTAWYCDVPPKGVAFRVIRSEWVDDYTVRKILEIELMSA